MTFRQRILLDRLLAVPLAVSLNALVALLGRILRRDHSIQPATTREIVVCKLVGMGSILQATPLLRALKQRFLQAWRQRCYTQRHKYLRIMIAETPHLWASLRHHAHILATPCIVLVVWLFVMPAHSVGNHHITVRHFFVFDFFLVLILVRSLRVSRPGQMGDGNAAINMGTSREPLRN